MTPELPAPPEHFYRFAWRGIPLILPEGWNLRLHEGTDQRGALVFSDMRDTRLELRWQTPGGGVGWKGKGAERLLEKSLGRLLKRRPGAAVERLAANAVRFELSGKRVTLVAVGGGRGRLFELSWAVADETGQETAIVTDLLETLRLVPWQDGQLWEVYGAKGRIPAGFRVKKLSLLPGAVTLAFRRRGATITLGAVSLADRLLADGRSLRDWATAAFPLVGRVPDGRWEESAGRATFAAADRRWLRRRRHVLELQHDPAANQIRWTHRTGLR